MKKIIEKIILEALEKVENGDYQIFFDYHKIFKGVN